MTDSGTAFQVVVSDPTDTITSGAATLTVNAAPMAPNITTQPANTTVTIGQSATFSVVASGDRTSLTYQWQQSGSPISGATSANYTTPPTSMLDNGSTYSVS